MAVPVSPNLRSGNGYMPFPLSRKAFNRGLPRRVGTIEDQLDTQDRRLDDVVSRLTAIETRPTATDPASVPELDGVVELVARLTERLQRIDKRARRSRRRLTVFADQVAVTLG